MTSKTKRDFFERLGPSVIWTLIISSIILIVVVIVFFIDNLNREKGFVREILTEKGMAIIKAFESGTRAGLLQMGWESFHIQKMIRAIGEESGIIYIFICDENGIALAHSDPNLIGKQIISKEQLIKIDPKKEPKSRTTYFNNKRVFEVYKIFKPIKPPRPIVGNLDHEHTKMWHGMGQRRMMMQGDMWCSPDTFPFKQVFIFVGLDIAPFEVTKRAQIKNTILLSISLLLTGIGGIFLSTLLFLYKKTKGELSYTSALTDTIVSNLPAGLMVLDPNKKIIYTNKELTTLLGKNKNMVGKSLLDEFPDEFVKAIDEIEKGESVKEIELSIGTNTNNPIITSLSSNKIFNEQGEVIGSIVIIRDLSEIKKLQQEVQRKEKLASIGRLAAGMAHEIRNPLSSIKGMATYYIQKFSEQSEEGKIGKILVEEVNRLNRVITELLEFAKPVSLQFENTKLKEVIEHSIRLISEDAKEKNIKIEIKIDPEDLSIKVDKDKFVQCILNIFINSLEAMDVDGELKILAKKIDKKEILIEISDTGHGIDEKDLQRIFDPYYTTKTTGTGLGLAIVHRIIESHNGRIEVKSTKGKGTTFYIYLPLNHRDEE